MICKYSPLQIIIMARETRNDPSAVMSKPAKGRGCNQGCIDPLKARREYATLVQPGG